MIPLPFEYERAATLDDAVARLAAANGNAKLIAGGHSLVPLMKLRLAQPARLIDIGHIPGLSGIRETDGRIEIGAGTVHHDVASSALLRKKCPVVADAAAAIGDLQVRNRGTLGGSLAHADPAADYPAAMLAADAEMHIIGPRGWRTVKADRFFRDLFTSDLAADEILARVQFAPAQASAYSKLYQRASHFAIVGVAAALEVRNGTIHAARVGITGAGPSAVRLAGVERALAGQPASQDACAAAARDAGAQVPAVNADLHASEDYRRAMIAVFTKRALEGAIARV
ncbi:MAG TPA: xanthine dehydrogenase family protein subunit M [Vicinamibacterales bacterium]|jgi:carbon-monoxide dehydrogenase medium subunit|nr:xanthine dehydrogenase family protein subunit M [Vicinamibacterales bacterium]